MKKLLVLIFALTMLLALAACYSETSVTDGYTTPLEKYFPADWADRYVFNEVEGVSIDVYCKSAHGNDTNYGWLFQIISGDTIPDDLPAVTELGTYDGKIVYATYPSDAYEFEDEEVAEDYRDMSNDVEEILHQLIHTLGGEHDHDEPVSTESTSTGTYVTPETLGFNNTYVGVFRLDTSRWSEESKNELLHENNQNGFLSIAPDGTAYLRCGSETTEGTALIYSDLENIPNDKPHYQLTFGGKTYGANLLQLVLTVDDMEEYTDVDGMQGTTWTFIHESDDWWTEATFTDDIG